MSKTRNHYYMVTALVTYVRRSDEVEIPKQKHMNAVLGMEDKKITSMVVNNAKQNILQRMIIEGDVQPDAIKDIVFLGWSYLGFMTDQEFHDIPEEKPIKLKTQH